jgi:3-deoxy-manno-octulosonate cytidylyltransferase (CMP-KDO synthetase)
VNHTGQKPPSNPKTKAVAIIPARYDSVRLPGKALLEIAGKPMICYVAQQARAARNVERVIVATDDQRIVDAVKSAGYEVVLTRADHQSGTDRIAEVAANLNDVDIIVNVQGDEPLISPETIERAVDELGVKGKGERGREQIGIVTTWEPIESIADVLSSDVVKIVVDADERALYFSRAPIPFPREAVRRHGAIEIALEREPELLTTFRKHTGLYVYRRDVLLEFTRWPQSELERLESLEQLRALENGVSIKAIKASSASIGVDTKDDLERVRQLVSSFEFQVSSF